MIKKNLTEDDLEILASSGLYDIQLPDGQVVDMKAWAYSDYLDDGNMSGFFKKIARKLKKGFHKILHKPLKGLPYLIGLGAVGALGDGVQSSITGIASKIGGTATKLIKGKKWTDLQRLVRTSLQATGVIPTQDMIDATMRQLVDRTVWGDYTQGQPVEIDPGNIEWPRQPQGDYISKRDLEQYLPWAVAGGLALILLMRK